MRNPFHIEGPAVIAFSGGRTSGLMLHHIIAAHGGTLPDDVVPVFCNTGKEHHATLDFVRDCAQQWGVHVRWIEWQAADQPAHRWREVNYATAARDGEPFAAMIQFRNGNLPNVVQRFCTAELKIFALNVFALGALGFERGYTKVIGLRADEPHRVARQRARVESHYDGWEVSFPLYDAGITSRDIVAFWPAQPFDLQLPLMPDGTTPMGNCDLCFLKAMGKIASIITFEPERAAWWAEQERITGRAFRKDRPGYAEMLRQIPIAFDAEPDSIDCACTD